MEDYAPGRVGRRHSGRKCAFLITHKKGRPRKAKGYRRKGLFIKSKNLGGAGGLLLHAALPHKQQALLALHVSKALYTASAACFITSFFSTSCKIDIGGISEASRRQLGGNPYSNVSFPPLSPFTLSFFHSFILSPFHLKKGAPKDSY